MHGVNPKVTGDLRIKNKTLKNACAVLNPVDNL